MTRDHRHIPFPLDTITGITAARRSRIGLGIRARVRDSKHSLADRLCSGQDPAICATAWRRVTQRRRTWKARV